MKLKKLEAGSKTWKVVKKETLLQRAESTGKTKAELDDYIKSLEIRRKRILEEVKSLYAAKFVGRYAKYIEEKLDEDIRRLNGTTMMVHEERALGPVSTRGTHIHNTARIAYQISMALFEDEEIGRGIALSALLHDMGQPAFGHDGENISSRTSELKQGGPRPHNATGASRILYRDSNKIISAMNKGIAIDVIKEEAQRRGMSTDELKERLNNGEETKLEATIKEKAESAKHIKNAAVRMLAMSSGRHNGERGTANIIPNYEADFKHFFEVLERCYVYQGADKDMQSGNMIDAIVKISDQISSIPYDMIDGKKGGVVIDIPETYAEPVAKILGVSEEEVKMRLQGDNEELNNLVKDIQAKLIESLVRNSDKQKIRMDLEAYMYGRKDKTGKTTVLGLRMPTYGEYLPYTTSEAEEKALQETWHNAIEILLQEVVDDNGIFDPKLNAIFRMKMDDPRRSKYEESLMEQYDGDEKFKDFYNYILQTSPEEYQFIKASLHEYGINLLREKIMTARKQYEENTGDYANNSSDEIEQGILNYIIVSHDGIPAPANGEEYTEEEIQHIHNRINHLRKIQGRKPLLLQRDERVAAQMALGYIEYRFHDGSFVDFCVNIGAMTPKQAQDVRQKYNPVTKQAHMSGSMQATSKAYEEAEQEGQDDEELEI